MANLYNNKLWTEDNNNEVYQQEEDNGTLIHNEKEKLRLKNQNKFDNIKNILKENMEFQERINLVILKTQFNYGKLKKKVQVVTIFFICFCILAMAGASYYTIKIKSYLLITLISVVIVMTILFLITIKVVKKSFYKVHIKKCDKMEINLENLVIWVGEILDNYGKLSEQVPLELVKSIPQKYSICNYDTYIIFICENNKNIKKKIKNKRLKIFKGIFCKNQYMLSIIEAAENNYFNTVFAYNRRDSLEEATKSYIENQE